MKNNYKLIAFIVLIVLVVYLFLHGKAETKRANDAEDGRNAAIHINNGIASKRYKNKQGDTVVVTQVIGIPKSQVDALLKEKDLQWIKKFDGLKKNGSNLQSAESFSTEFNLDAIPERIKYLPCKDSVKVTDFSIHDQWNYIEAKVVGTPQISISDRYYGTVYMKRPKGWFWKFQWSKWESVSEITNSNKLIRIDSVAVFVIKK